MPALRLVQGTDAWRIGRREYITGTDIAVLLGISPYRCEADLADEKRGLVDGVAETLRMRIGKALEDTIVAEWERESGERAQRYRAMVVHPAITWAAASPDARVVGRRCLLELKWSGSRSRFADGLPQDIEAQVQWQLGVTGYPEAEVVALTPDELLRFRVTFDQELFGHLVAVATDFRRRLETGGPFARDGERVRRDHPSDDGSEIEADADTAEACRALLEVRASIKRAEETEKRLMTAIQARMGDAATMTGFGFRATWKRSKDREETDWKAVAARLIAPLPETDRDAVVREFTSVRTGMRPFRLVADSKETQE